MCVGTVCGGPSVWPVPCWEPDIGSRTLSLMQDGGLILRDLLGSGLWSMGFLIHHDKVRREKGKYSATGTRDKILGP